MKVFIVLALAVATVSAFDLRAKEIEPRNIKVPVQKTEGRIINGDDAEPGQFPYQVGLSLQKNILQQYWCGGSLLNNEWVLTAAHCVDGGIKKGKVYLGATDRNAAEVTHTVYKKDFIIHADWDPVALTNDIALIAIPSTSYSENIQPVKLPAVAKSYSSYAGDSAIASGWGRTSDDEKSSIATLQYAEMSIVSNRICKKVYGLKSVKSSNICVASVDGVGTCQGDSGGPLVLASTGIQVGLTSFGAEDGCELGFPNVFTRVTSYLDWIEDNTGASQ